MNYLWFVRTVAEGLLLARIEKFLLDILRQQWQEVVLIQIIQVVQLHVDGRTTTTTNDAKVKCNVSQPLFGSAISSNWGTLTRSRHCNLHTQSLQDTVQDLEHA